PNSGDAEELYGIYFYPAYAFFLLLNLDKRVIIHVSSCSRDIEFTLERQVHNRMPMFERCFQLLRGARFLPGFALLACSTLPAQSLIQGSGPGASVLIFNTDAAVLESQDVRKDLPCTVTPVKP